MKYGFLFRWQSFWIGVHYSKFNKRFCINPFFCCTIWATLPGGKTPDQDKM